MEHKSIIYSKENGVAYLQFNRPKVFHSFNREMAMALQDGLDKAAEDEEVRCVYITGEGKAFCAGQDLGEATGDDALDIKKIVDEHYNPIIRRIRDIEKPVVCAVNGVAAGAGATIAIACDIVVATKSATFIQAFSKIGLIPDSGGTFFLPRLVGMGKAAGLMFLGDNVTAEEAEKMNMIYAAYEDGEFEEKAKGLAEKLAKMPTRGIALTKQLLNESWNNDLNVQLEREASTQKQATETHDFEEGVSAFMEKRKPDFRGK